MKVLLIDSDPRAALLVGEMLRVGWEGRLVCARAERVAEAAQELRDQGAAGVLLGLPQAGIDPFSAIEQIRDAAPDVPIIVLAEDGDHHQALSAIGAGAQDYLLKAQLQPATLARALANAMARKRTEAKLAHRALHDPLTGLPNRVLFLDRLSVALDRSRRSGATIAVLFLDVDNFKQVNDSLGHAAGDRLLAALAERMRAMLRPMDTVGRFGGDEFTFLFEDLASEREVVLIADRISRAAGAPITLEGRELSVTVSIGIAIVSDPGAQLESVIREADAAMYRAKELGRSRYELFDETSRRRAIERLDLEAALREALERSELRVHYQPNVSLGENSGVVGLEALVRWEHPERGTIAPDEFIPLAEEMGLMLPIGTYVLQQALRQLARWRRQRPDLTVSVNISARQLEDVSLISTLTSAIKASGIEHQALCLEVGERVITGNGDAMIRALRALKGMGVQIAIDDFGTGPSSLSTLKRLPIDTLKLHESLLSGLGVDPHERSVVGAVVELGHALGLDVVAEGVETDAQLAELRTLGCDRAQGYLFGHPVPAEEVQAMLGPASLKRLPINQMPAIKPLT